MAIEKQVIAYLNGAQTVPCYGETPANPSGQFITVEKTGGGEPSDGLRTGTVAIQCYAASTSAACDLCETIRSKMLLMPYSVANVSKVIGNEPYNFTDTTTKWHRYQVLIDLFYI